MMVVLKIPIALLLYIVWWAVHQMPEVGGSSRRRRRRRQPAPAAPRDRLPRGPRRGPHAEPAPAVSPRVRASSRAAARPRRTAAASSVDPRRARARLRAMAHVRALRRHDPPPRGGGPDQDRPVGRGDDPAGELDLRLGRSFRVFHNHRVDGDRPPRPAAATSPSRSCARRRTSRSSIHPGEFVPRRAPRSGSSCPTTSSRASRENRRSAASGLIVHATAGFVDPGFEGHADARGHQPDARPDQALAGAADRPALVHDARPPAERPYGHPDLGSHYHGQVEATESRYEGGPCARRCRAELSARVAHRDPRASCWRPRRRSAARRRSSSSASSRRCGRSSSAWAACARRRSRRAPRRGGAITAVSVRPRGGLHGPRRLRRQLSDRG